MPTVVSAQKPTTGYASVNGLNMYCEVHGTGEPVILLHGSLMTIASNWEEMIAGLSKTRKVVAVEMQGHGRTRDIDRDFSTNSSMCIGTALKTPSRLCAFAVNVPRIGPNPIVESAR